MKKKMFCVMQRSKKRDSLLHGDKQNTCQTNEIESIPSCL